MHPGLQLASALWVLSVLVAALVGLRFYTQVRVVRFVGTEDYMYAATGLSLLFFTIFTQVSAAHGIGRTSSTLAASTPDAIYWSYVANTVIIIGNALAKVTLAEFLLRLARRTWHRMILSGVIIVTTIISAVLAILLWTETAPANGDWVDFGSLGRRNSDIQSLGVALGTWSTACDFFFAISPYFIFRALEISRPEKTALAGGMTLSALAGACGIARTVVLSRINATNYTESIVGYFIGAGLEIFIAMLCLAVPTIRPLYFKVRNISDKTLPSTWRGDRGGLPQFEMNIEVQRNKFPDRTSSFGSSNDDSTVLTLPPKSHNRSCNGSISETIGSEAPTLGGIWVQNEIEIRESVAEWPLRS